MPDYGQELRFGVFLTPAAADAEAVLELAQTADASGLDYVTVQDHPYQARFLDNWTLLSTIAARTQSIRVAPNVANLPLRHPMMIARSVASLDILSGGRVELGLGAGAFWDAVEANGGPRRTPGESVDALVEAVALIRACWAAGDRAIRHRGVHYQVVGAHPGPAPLHEVELWLGAYGPRMLALTGAQADGWVPSMGYADPERLAELSARVDEGAEQAGRAPVQIRRVYNINGSFGTGSGFLTGSAPEWAEQLAELTLSIGISTYLLSAQTVQEVRRFAEEVAPATAELVAAGRRGAQTAARPDATGPIRAGAELTPFRPRATEAPVRRFSSELLLDEAGRPSGPAPVPGRLYSEVEQAQGRHLIDVHDVLRRELTQLRNVIEQVGQGGLDPQSARDHLAAMTIRQNSWTVGTFCMQYCRALSGHHTLEDVSVFPHLKAREPALGPVLDCLFAEHEVIAASLERIDRALVTFIADASAFAGVRAAVDAMSDALLSHLSYEERELIEPLARVGFS